MGRLCITCRKFANGQDIEYSENKIAPGLHLPFYWGYFPYFTNMLIGTCIYVQQISGESLQDHWSSGLFNVFWLRIVLSTDGIPVIQQIRLSSFTAYSVSYDTPLMLRIVCLYSASIDDDVALALQLK